MSDNIANAINLLLSAGYKEAGYTATENVRIPTTRSPVFGGVGGEARTFGGRARFEHPSGLRATVGKRTVNFYRSQPTGKLVGDKYVLTEFAQIKTKDLDGLKNELVKRHSLYEGFQRFSPSREP